jgi:hypothetical protein
LATLVPEPMVPAAVVVIDAVPTTANGKVDVNALPPPSFDGEEAAVPPAGPVEEVLCHLWAEVLGSSEVGAEDDFFAHGGHSLLATRLATRIRDSLRVNLALRTLFENPTPRAIAAELRAGDDGERVDEVAAIVLEVLALPEVDVAEALTGQRTDEAP